MLEVNFTEDQNDSSNCFLGNATVKNAKDIFSDN